MKTIKILFLAIDFVMEMFSGNAMAQPDLNVVNSIKQGVSIHCALLSTSAENFVTSDFSNVDFTDELEEEDEWLKVYRKVSMNLQLKRSAYSHASEFNKSLPGKGIADNVDFKLLE